MKSFFLKLYGLIVYVSRTFLFLKTIIVKTGRHDCYLRHAQVEVPDRRDLSSGQS